VATFDVSGGSDERNAATVSQKQARSFQREIIKSTLLVQRMTVL